MNQQDSLPGRAAETNRYRVDVGHVSIQVQAGCAKEAVQAARRQLCVELPRLWDRIRAMEVHRFRVQTLP